MTDILTLGGIVFDNFSTPSEMMGGGRQTMVVHKLPGGARVIDTLGPDEADITFNGQFYGNDSYEKVRLLDGMRQSGVLYALTWGGQYRSVIIEQFIYKVRRYPVWINYNISLKVYQNPSLGNLGGIVNSIDTLVMSDLSTAVGLAG